MSQNTPKSLRERDNDLCRTVLTRLGAISNRYENYTAQRAFEIENQLIWLTAMFGEHWYIPNSTPKKLIAEVAQLLQTDRIDEKKVRGALDKLWMVTKHDRDSANSKPTILDLYVEKLAPYETDAILTVLQRASSEMKFWPTWSELEDRLKDVCPERTALLRALRRVYPLVKERSA